MKIFKEYSVLFYIAGCLVLFSIFSIVGTSLNKSAEMQISELLAGEQVLQATAVRNAVNENLQRLVNESHILSSYSFPEYEAGVRTRASMENLLQIELGSYQDSVAYSFLDYSGVKTVNLSDSDDIGQKGLALARQWESSYRDEIAAVVQPPVVPPMVSDGEYIFLGYLFPVYLDDELRGSFTVVINLKQPVERYINPLYEDMSGIPLVFDQNLRILWDPEDRLSGRLITTLYPFLESSGAELLKKRVSDEVEGRALLENEELGNGDAGRLSISWSSLKIKEQNIIIALISEEKELLALLKNHRRERLVLYAVLSLSLFAASGGLVVAQRMIINKRDLTAQVEQKTSKLNNLLKRYTTLFDSANDAIFLLRGYHIVNCNQKALELFEADEPAAFIGLTPAEISSEYQAGGEMSGVLAKIRLDETRAEGAMIFEWRHRSLKGRLFDAEVSIKMIQLDDDLVAQAIVRDISERVHALEEKDVMMKEIHHRVKNNLQIISSFLNLQKNNLSTPETIEVVFNTQRRVDVMAKMHEVLYAHDDLSRISASEYFSEIINFFIIRQEAADGPAILSDLEDVDLDPDSCMYTGFVLSELVDNALKHGCTGTVNARVTVTLRVEENEGFLSVHDSGAGFVPEAGRMYSGLGLQLISALEIQVGGRLEWSAADGTRAVFSFPLSS